MRLAPLALALGVLATGCHTGPRHVEVPAPSIQVPASPFETEAAVRVDVTVPDTPFEAVLFETHAPCSQAFVLGLARLFGKLASGQEQADLEVVVSGSYGIHKGDTECRAWCDLTLVAREGALTRPLFRRTMRRETMVPPSPSVRMSVNGRERRYWGRNAFVQPLSRITGQAAGELLAELARSKEIRAACTESARAARRARPTPPANPPAPAPAAVSETSARATYTILVDSVPGDAEVSVDGVSRGKTPLAVGELAPGTYTVAVTSAGVRREARVVVTPGDPAVVTFNFTLPR